MTTCPRCHAATTPGDRFCADCGARVMAPDAPPAGGWAEAIGPGFAARTDPGVTHAANQDAFALSQGIMVVCDGVSNSQTPHLAASTAAAVAHAALAAAQADQPRADAMREAIRLAHAAVCALPFDRQADLDPPATTLVAAWLHGGGATLGWLGDSRAYLLGTGLVNPAGDRQLTRDHSWMAMMLECGEMTPPQAARDPRAHALTHCLGTTDFSRPSPCPEPGLAEVALQTGWLLLCSDGLWNYAPTAAALREAGGQGLNGDAADLCARLISFARGCGGHDNITAAAMRWAG